MSVEIVVIGSHVETESKFTCKSCQYEWAE
jgi:transposase-like protein